MPETTLLEFPKEFKTAESTIKILDSFRKRVADGELEVCIVVGITREGNCSFDHTVLTDKWRVIGALEGLKQAILAFSP